MLPSVAMWTSQVEVSKSESKTEPGPPPTNETNLRHIHQNPLSNRKHLRHIYIGNSAGNEAPASLPKANKQRETSWAPRTIGMAELFCSSAPAAPVLSKAEPTNPMWLDRRLLLDPKRGVNVESGVDWVLHRTPSSECWEELLQGKE